MTRQIPHIFRDGIEYKRCATCKKELKLACFGKQSRAPDGLKGSCKACRNKSKNPFFEADPDSTSKTCNTCVVRKHKSEFRDNRNRCMECDKASGRKYRRVHPEKAKKWVDENKERMSEL